MSDLDDNTHKDIGLIENIKEIIRLSIEKSKENFENNIGDIIGFYVNYTLDNDERAITLEVKDLNNLKFDDYTQNILNNDIQKIISNLINLKELNLSANNIKQITPDLKNLEDLEILNLSDNGIEVLPNDVLTSSNLKLVNFSKNLLTGLQGTAKQLILLERIDLSENNFTTIPNVNTFAQNLKILNLSSNKIQSVSSPINRMANLQELYIGNNKVKTVEKNVFYNSLHLRILDLSNNLLREINFDYSRLAKLEKLCIYGNPISDFRRISNIIQRIIQNRDFKGIEKNEKHVIAFFEILVKDSELKYEIEGTNIIKLEIPFQKIEQLPENIGSLTKLKVLDVKGNKLKSLPKSFEKLTNLEMLDLSVNYGIKLPNDFSLFRKLKELNIAYCNLPIILDSLIELKNLKKLNISSNRISKIHPKIGNLEYLEELDLSYNELEEIQLPLLELKSLKHLNLAGNKIHRIPEAISILKHLEVLNLNFNHIQNLVISLSVLNNLKALYLIHNRINEIPGYIFNLRSLKKVHFTANNISTISGDVNISEKFEEFYISENPLPNHLRYKYFAENYKKKITLRDLNLCDVYSFRDSQFIGLSQLSLLVGTNNSGKSNFFKIIENLQPFSYIDRDIIFTNANPDEVLLHYTFELSDEIINYIVEYIKLYSEGSCFINFNNLLIIGNGLTVKFYEFLKNIHLITKLYRGGTQYQNYVDLFGFLSKGKSINLIQYSEKDNYQTNINILKPNWKKIITNSSATTIDFAWTSNNNPHILSSQKLSKSLYKKNNVDDFDFALFIYNAIMEFFEKLQKITEHRNFESESPLGLEHDSIILENGVNFPDILELFLHEDLELLSILRSLIGEFYPEVNEIWSESVKNNSNSSISINSKPFIKEFTEKRYFENLGKGIHQILIILTHLLQLGENYTLMIEEPELFIHPQLQKILYNIIQRFLPFHQIFITTHSPFILNSHDDNSSIHQIVKLNDESVVKNVKKSNLTEVIQKLGVRPSDILMNNGFLLVEGERDIRLFKKLFKEIIKEKHIELIPFSGKDKLHYYADHDIISKLIDRGFKFRIILDRDEGNQKTYEDIKNPLVKEHILLLPVREIENLYLNPELFEIYLIEHHKEDFESENVADFIENVLTEAITEEMLWNCQVKTFMDGIKFRFSREEIKKIIKLTSVDELLDALDALVQQKYHINGIEKEYYLIKFKEIETKINSEKEKWKIVDGKKLRNSISQELKNKKGITINFEKIESLMKEDIFTLNNLIYPIEGYFDSI